MWRKSGHGGTSPTAYIAAFEDPVTLAIVIDLERIICSARCERTYEGWTRLVPVSQSDKRPSRDVLRKRTVSDKQVTAVVTGAYSAIPKVHSKKYYN